LIASNGCDDRNANESPPAPARVVGKGVIHGRVTFRGTAPVMKEIDTNICHPGAPKLTEETVLVGAGGGLKNVFVHLEGAPKSAGPDEPAMLDQVHCRYVPHVLGVTVGQKLVVKSSDPTMHNVHLIAEKNAAANFGMTAAGLEKTLTFTHSETIRVKCDVHPWMTAYVIVCENPFFALSNDDGKFEIKDLPPGEYKLVAWHELYGKLEQAVSVSKDRPAVVKFEYKEP
jgi:plastocyanin